MTYAVLALMIALQVGQAMGQDVNNPIYRPVIKMCSGITGECEVSSTSPTVTWKLDSGEAMPLPVPGGPCTTWEKLEYGNASRIVCYITRLRPQDLMPLVEPLPPNSYLFVSNWDLRQSDPSVVPAIQEKQTIP